MNYKYYTQKQTITLVYECKHDNMSYIYLLLGQWTTFGGIVFRILF